MNNNCTFTCNIALSVDTPAIEIKHTVFIAHAHFGLPAGLKIRRLRFQRPFQGRATLSKSLFVLWTTPVTVKEMVHRLQSTCLSNCSTDW